MILIIVKVRSSSSSSSSSSTSSHSNQLVNNRNRKGSKTGKHYFLPFSSFHPLLTHSYFFYFLPFYSFTTILHPLDVLDHNSINCAPVTSSRFRFLLLRSCYGSSFFFFIIFSPSYYLQDHHYTYKKGVNIVIYLFASSFSEASIFHLQQLSKG